MTRSPNYPITETGSIDMLGDEFPSLFYAPKPQKPSPLMTDVPGADTSNWSSEARPAVTAYEGADMDAYWLDNGTWRHCRSGEAWEGEPVNLLTALRAKIDADNEAINSMLAEVARLHAETAEMQGAMGFALTPLPALREADAMEAAE